MIKMNPPGKMIRIYKRTLKRFLEHEAWANKLTPHSPDWFEGPDEKGDKLKHQLSGMAKAIGLNREQRAAIKKEVKEEIKKKKRVAKIMKGAFSKGPAMF